MRIKTAAKKVADGLSFLNRIATPDEDDDRLNSESRDTFKITKNNKHDDYSDEDFIKRISHQHVRDSFIHRVSHQQLHHHHPTRMSQHRMSALVSKPSKAMRLTRISKVRCEVHTVNGTKFNFWNVFLEYFFVH